MSVNPNPPNPAAPTSPFGAQYGMTGVPLNPDGSINVEKYNQQIAVMTQAWQASAGLQRKQIEAQIADLTKARDNAMKIAQLQSDTQRYGYDQTRQTQIDQLKEQQRQYDSTHALDMQKFGLSEKQFGLDYADKATQYLSSPDRYFQGADFINMASRALAGQGGPTPYMSNGTPTPNTAENFAILANGGKPVYTIPGTAASSAPADTTQATASAAPAGVTVDPQVAQASQQASASGYGTNAATTGGAGADDRVKALQALTKALPPSVGDGLDDNDYAVLQAARAIYSRNNPSGYLNTLRPGQKSILESAGKRLGISVPDWEADQVRNAIGQRSTRAA